MSQAECLVKLRLPDGSSIMLQTEESMLELDGIANRAKTVKYNTDGSWKMLKVKVHYPIMVWAGVYIIVEIFFSHF